MNQGKTRHGLHDYASRLILVAMLLAGLPLAPARAEETGDISTVAGNGLSGFSGDGGPGTNASLSNPAGVAIDGSGNVYVADRDNNRVRRVTPAGTIMTFAGNGSYAHSGDGGLATDAGIYGPYGLAFDSSGNLYIAETNSGRVRRVSTSGTISTVAGNAETCVYSGGSGDGGPATSASLCNPRGLALDSSGNLYIADSHNARVRKVSTGGTITTVAGGGTNAYSGDGVPATETGLSFPSGVAIDGSDRIYITDYHGNAVRRVDSTGTITTFAGNGGSGFTGDGGPAASATIWGPNGLSFDLLGNLYISDQGNSRIRRVSPDGTITTVAGNGTRGYGGDGGPATNASLFDPAGVAVDSSGNVYIADFGNQRVRRVESASSPSGRYLVLGDSVSYGHGLANPTASDKPCNEPGQLACTFPGDQGPSPGAFPSLLAGDLDLRMTIRSSGCALTGDQLAVSGAMSTFLNTYALNRDGSINYAKITAHDTDCDKAKAHKSIQPEELAVDRLIEDPPALVTVLAGANDIRFVDCFLWELKRFGFGPTSWASDVFAESDPRDCTSGQGLADLRARLNFLEAGLQQILDHIHENAPAAKVLLLNYYQPIPPSTASLTANNALCNALAFKGRTRIGEVAQTRKRAEFWDHGTQINQMLNQAIANVATRNPWVNLIDLSSAFMGHELCTQDSYVFSLTAGGSPLYEEWWRVIHPNESGHQVLADLIARSCRFVGCAS